MDLCLYVHMYGGISLNITSNFIHCAGEILFNLHGNLYASVLQTQRRTFLLLSSQNLLGNVGGRNHGALRAHG